MLVAGHAPFLGLLSRVVTILLFTVHAGGIAASSKLETLNKRLARPQDSGTDHHISLFPWAIHRPDISPDLNTLRQIVILGVAGAANAKMAQTPYTEQGVQ